MALQSSGAITLADIAGEFGGSTPHGINEYYGAATGVPSSGVIAIDDFYGTAAAVGILSHQFIGNYTTGTSTGFTFNLPAGTKSVIVGGCKRVNDFEANDITSCTSSNGGAMTSCVIQDRQTSESGRYGTYARIWVVNLSSPLSVATNVTFTMTYASTVVDGNYGKVCNVVALDRTFNSYTPSATGVSNLAQSTSTITLTNYDGGITVGIGIIAGTSGNFTTNYTVRQKINAGRPGDEQGYISMYNQPSSTSSLGHSFSPTDGWGDRNVGVAVSFALSKFN